MKYMLRVTVAILLTSFSVHSSSAQVRLFANADVTRLVAMHVSDQTVIAVIHEATPTQFDLTARALEELAVSGVSTAVIDAMRQATPAPLLANGISAAGQSPTARAPTLEEASAAAKLVPRGEWGPPTVSGGSPRAEAEAPTTAVSPAISNDPSGPY